VTERTERKDQHSYSLFTLHHSQLRKVIITLVICEISVRKHFRVVTSIQLDQSFLKQRVCFQRICAK